MPAWPCAFSPTKSLQVQPATSRTQIALTPGCGSKPSSKVALFFICAKQRDHKGKQSQAPKQVLGVVTLHAVCEE